MLLGLSIRPSRRVRALRDGERVRVLIKVTPDRRNRQGRERHVDLDREPSNLFLELFFLKRPSLFFYRSSIILRTGAARARSCSGVDT